ncbi:MAG TPA: hypothetical protein VL096_12260 [Pirellulaceae bacterium]|nr:hypothetical protein [Pirellulaceae bacterium]
MTALDITPQLDLFHGDATARLARIYARLPNASNCKIAGQLRGPQCFHSSTLPATVPFRDQGPGETLLAAAILPDPCFWSPEVPALYSAHIELRSVDATLSATERVIGLKAWGARGRFFYDQGKRVVIRGHMRSSDDGSELLQWHDTPLDMLAINPCDALCDEASRIGVRIIACLDEQQHQVAVELRRLARHAAVTIVAMRGSLTIDKQLQQLAPNLLLARWLAIDDAPTSNDQAEAIIAEVGEPSTFADKFKHVTCPVVACRTLGSTIDLVAARAAADQLQADLAPHGDFAGYVV